MAFSSTFLRKLRCYCKGSVFSQPWFKAIHELGISKRRTRRGTKAGERFKRRLSIDGRSISDFSFVNTLVNGTDLDQVINKPVSIIDKPVNSGSATSENLASCAVVYNINSLIRPRHDFIKFVVRKPTVNLLNLRPVERIIYSRKPVNQLSIHVQNIRSVRNKAVSICDWIIS